MDSIKRLIIPNKDNFDRWLMFYFVTGVLIYLFFILPKQTLSPCYFHASPLQEKIVIESSESTDGIIFADDYTNSRGQ